MFNEKVVETHFRKRKAGIQLKVMNQKDSKVHVINTSIMLLSTYQCRECLLFERKAKEQKV